LPEFVYPIPVIKPLEFELITILEKKVLLRERNLVFKLAPEHRKGMHDRIAYFTNFYRNRADKELSELEKEQKKYLPFDRQLRELYTVTVILSLKIYDILEFKSAKHIFYNSPAFTKSIVNAHLRPYQLQLLMILYQARVQEEIDDVVSRYSINEKILNDIEDAWINYITNVITTCMEI